ncbi:fimbrial protein [Serratia silvae]
MKHSTVRYFGRTVIVGMLVSLLGALTASPTLAVGENNVRLYGSLVAEPCVIAPGKEEIVLDFGTVIDKYLYLNTRTIAQPFSIHLAECDLSLGKTMKITFIGPENPALKGLLAIDGSSSASGIAIGLETTEGKSLALNKGSYVQGLQTGDTIVALKAYVQAEPDAITKRSIKRGTFSATATFSLEYE